jgi:hypothetical protein
LCGQVAYSGSEMYAALDMRQKLVNDALQSGGDGEAGRNLILLAYIHTHIHTYSIYIFGV